MKKRAKTQQHKPKTKFAFIRVNSWLKTLSVKIRVICGQLFMQNEPISKTTKIAITPFKLKTKASSLKPVSQENEPKRSHLTFPFSVYFRAFRG